MFREARELVEFLNVPHNMKGENTAEQKAMSLFTSREIPFKPAWHMNIHEVLHGILWDFLWDDSGIHNSFREFAEYTHTYNDNEQSTYIVLTNGCDRVLTCGARYARVRQRLDNGESIWDNCPGSNLYGRALKRLIQEWLDVNSQQPVLRVEQMLTRIVIPEVQYSRTVALVSDSMLGFASSVEGGDIFYKGGATCEKLVKLLVANHVFLNRYHVVIICVGTNDHMNLDPYEQSVSLQKLITFLQPLVNLPSTRIILNTGIGVVKWPGTEAYATWFINTITSDLMTCGGNRLDNITFCDWSRPDPANQLMDANREPSDHLMCSDGRHPNHHGLRHMLKRWIQIYAPIGNVDIRFDENVKYPVGQLSEV